MFRATVLTLFPEMFPGPLGLSLAGDALSRGVWTLEPRQIREHGLGRHRAVDDTPAGGGPGMVMKVEPMAEAVEAIKRDCAAHSASGCQTILMSPQGERLSSAAAKSLAGFEHLLIICGHYEGVDERVKLALVDQSLSIGDYVLTGGELPAMVLMDCVARFIPGVIGHPQATEEESFAQGWLEYPQYTRPPVFRDLAVPEVLVSGDHEQVARWRKRQSVARTLAARPDLVRRPFDSAQCDQQQEA